MGGGAVPLVCMCGVGGGRKVAWGQGGGRHHKGMALNLRRKACQAC